MGLKLTEEKSKQKFNDELKRKNVKRCDFPVLCELYQTLKKF